MSIEATADALVAEQAAPIEATPPEEDLSALFDRMNAEPEQVAEDAPEAEDHPEAEEAPQAEDVAEEPQEEPLQLPGNLPQSLRDHLSKMPKEAAQAVLTDREGLHRKLSDMGRQVQGIAPVRDVLVDAAKRYPYLADLRPDQVGQELLSVAEMGNRLHNDPVGTLMQAAKKYGVEQAMAERLSGQPVSDQAQTATALTQHIQQLERKIAQLTDPSYLQSQVTQITSQQSVENEVLTFSQQAEYWSDVETYVPDYIPIAQKKLGDGAAPSAVLKLAYEKAIQDYKPEALQASKPEAVADPSPAPDPEKTKAAVKAKSVNVTGKSSGKPRVLTEAEELSLIYDKSAKR